MANLTDSILEAIQTEMSSNSQFAALNEVYIVQAIPESFQPNLFTSPPFALIYPLSTSFEPACISDGQQTVDGFYHRANNANYEIGISVLVEWWPIGQVGITGQTGFIGVAEWEKRIQDVFDRNALSLGDTVQALFTGASYSPGGFSDVQAIAHVACSLQYSDLDLLG